MNIEQLQLEHLQPGDIVYAAGDIENDGSLPDMPEGALLAAAGSRGVLINTGHLEEDESATIYLVRFENADGELGPAVGCWPQELSDKAA
jgi:nitrogen fixation protein NifZ